MFVFSGEGQRGHNLVLYFRFGGVEGAANCFVFFAGEGQMRQ